jgi:hypothetical protein
LRHKLAQAWERVEKLGEIGIMLRQRRNELPAWIPQAVKLRPHQRAILQAIADRCGAAPVDESGSLGYAIIGFDSLAAACGMCRRTAISHVKKLVGMGMLWVVEAGGMIWHTGEARANRYGIPGAFDVPIPQQSEGVQILHSPHQPHNLDSYSAKLALPEGVQNDVGGDEEPWAEMSDDDWAYLGASEDLDEVGA